MVCILEVAKNPTDPITFDPITNPFKGTSKNGKFTSKTARILKNMFQPSHDLHDVMDGSQHLTFARRFPQKGMMKPRRSACFFSLKLWGTDGGSSEGYPPPCIR